MIAVITVTNIKGNILSSSSALLALYQKKNANQITINQSRVSDKLYIEYLNISPDT